MLWVGFTSNYQQFNMIQRAIAFDLLQKERRLKQRPKHFFPLRSTINLPLPKAFSYLMRRNGWVFFSFLITPMNNNLIFSRMFIKTSFNIIS